MRTLPNINLTANFTRYEVIEARLPVVKDNRGNVIADCKAMNWQHIKEYKEERYVELLTRIEEVRTDINRKFNSDTNPSKPIGLMITSGFRCKAWEKYRRRSGSSAHTVAAAVDLQPVNCSAELAVKIIAYLNEKYGDRRSGWIGGFAIKDPTYNREGELLAVGFVHFDNKPGANRRWTY